jgi:hypothetical protein
MRCPGPTRRAMLTAAARLARAEDSENGEYGLGASRLAGGLDRLGFGDSHGFVVICAAAGARLTPGKQPAAQASRCFLS